MKLNFKFILIGLIILSPIAVTHTLAAEIPSQKYDRAAWMDQAKFGMFIHWGLYSELARGEWVMNKEKIPVKEYEKLASKFNPVKFNADEWVKIVKDAGMKYIVITSKHHDGFSMFGSSVSSYNIVKATPFKRDPLKELQKACMKQGIKFGVYYSDAQDWHYPGGAINGGSWDPAQKGDFDTYFNNKALLQIKELLSGYGSIAELWCDTPNSMTPEKARELVKKVREVQPTTVVNSRVLYNGRAVAKLSSEKLDELREIGVDFLSYGDRQIPEKPIPGWHWETCMTLNHSWGYTEKDNNWKSPETVIRQLVEVSSKGGSFLLNVGPTAEGVIPGKAVDILSEVGDWLKVNGESIYGTKPVSIGTTNTVDETDSKDKKKSPDWLATGKDGKIYIHIFKWPAGKFKISGIKGSVKKAYMLADPKQNSVKFKQKENSITVFLTKKALDDKDTVLCLVLK